MAKVVAPLQSAEARGAVSGLIYNTWRGISYAKKFTSPAQPRTARQLSMRSILATLVRAWRNLSPTVRAQWDAYAADHPLIDWTGKPKRITGANMYTALNARLADMDETLITNPPFVAAPNAVAGFAVLSNEEELIVEWHTTGDNLVVNTWVDGPHSAGRLTRLPKARHDAYTAAATGEREIPGVVVGQFWSVWARVIDTDNGLASPWLNLTSEIVPDPGP